MSRTMQQVSQWQLDEWEALYPDLLNCDGFEDALIGLCEIHHSEHIACLAYDYDKCVEILMDRDRMTRDDAEEYMEYNVVSAYVGRHTPAFVTMVEWEE